MIGGEPPNPHFHLQFLNCGWRFCSFNSLFTPFQRWLLLVVFHLKGDFLSNFVLILIILNLSLRVPYYTVKLWTAYFWTTWSSSFTCYQRKLSLLKSSLWISHLKMIKIYRKLDRKSPFTYVPHGDLANWKVANCFGLEARWLSHTKNLFSLKMCSFIYWLIIIVEWSGRTLNKNHEIRLKMVLLIIRCWTSLLI